MAARIGIKLLVWFLGRSIDAIAGTALGLVVSGIWAEEAHPITESDVRSTLVLVLFWMLSSGYALLSLYVALVGQLGKPAAYAFLHAGFFFFAMLLVPIGVTLLHGTWGPETWRYGLLLLIGPGIAFLSTYAVRSLFARYLD